MQNSTLADPLANWNATHTQGSAPGFDLRDEQYANQKWALEQPQREWEFMQQQYKDSTARKNAAMTALMGSGWNQPDKPGGYGGLSSAIGGNSGHSPYTSLFGLNNNFGSSSSGGGKMFQPSMGFAEGGLVPRYYAEGGQVPLNNDADVPGLMTPQGVDLGGVVPRIGQGLGGLPPDPMARGSVDLTDPRGVSAPMGTGPLGADGKGGVGKKVDMYSMMVKRGGDPEAAARYTTWLEQKAKQPAHGQFTSVADQMAGERMNAAVWNNGNPNANRQLEVDRTRYMATGGVVGMHPGQPRGTDTIPAWLTPGEAVLTPQATQAIGGKPAVDTLNSIGKGGLYAAAQQRGLPPVRSR